MKVTCNARVCDKKLSYKDGSTSSLRKHLEKQHEISTDQKRSAPTTTDAQPTLSGFLSKKAKLDSKSPAAVTITNLVSSMITKDLQPLSFIEDKGFRDLMHHLEPRYTLPSRKTFREVILPRKFQNTRAELLIKLGTHRSNQSSTACAYSLTTDAWASRYASSYLTYTVHLLDEDFKFQAYVLGTYKVSESHTSDMLKNHIIRILKEWNLVSENEVSAELSQPISIDDNLPQDVHLIDEVGCEDEEDSENYDYIVPQ